MPKFVISLDFEMFWGVADSRSLANYRQNVSGERVVIPKILELFRKYRINATWATVGMLMCRNYAQWREIEPSLLPGYVRRHCSTYSLDSVVREHPDLFFARPLVEQVLNTPGQEVATHTYSHFYCGEDGATPAQFAADIDCAIYVAAEIALRFRSIVFPRNQVLAPFLGVLSATGIKVYRGNSDHLLYRDGHLIHYGFAGRLVRFADGWLPLSGDRVTQAVTDEAAGLTNIPASMFLRPYPKKFAAFEPLRLARITKAMTAAARNGGVFHLWWHPHNFGVNIEKNLAVLESVLRHFIVLRDRYGMGSASMAHFSPVAAA